MKWQNKNIVILGAGKSGIAAALKLKELGNQVVLSEFGAISNEVKERLTQYSIAFEENGHQVDTIKQADIIIASPGIPLTAPPFQWAAEVQVPVISEIELAYQLTSIPCIAITGSNGKTTTVSLVGELLNRAGLKAQICGNIGIPFIECVDKELDYLVVEVSSFQLETIQHFRPKIALILNLYPNHLNRHNTMDNYFQIKSRIYSNQTPDDWAIVNGDNEWTQTLAPKSRIAYFSQHTQPDLRAGLKDKQLAYLKGEQFISILPLEKLPLKGSHNVENYLAMMTVASILDIEPVYVKETILNFSGVEHRLELVKDYQNRQFVNDSKATNYLATLKALESFSEPIVLILGGEDKGGDFEPLVQAIKKRVRQVVLMGASAQDFFIKLSEFNCNNCIIVGSMEEAVRIAFRYSLPGDIVLLSPACASYDMYQNFEKRGEDYKTHVENIASTV